MRSNPPRILNPNNIGKPSIFRLRPFVRNFPRQALHAFRLGFTHPITAETMTFDSELPYDMSALIEGLNAKDRI
mgnify:CR=1 FL=1